MEHTKLPEEETKNPTEDITEEQFLKDLYTFMKKRDTPIERIPNLGFKQSKIKKKKNANICLFIFTYSSYVINIFKCIFIVT